MRNDVHNEVYSSINKSIKILDKVLIAEHEDWREEFTKAYMMGIQALKVLSIQDYGLDEWAKQCGDEYIPGILLAAGSSRADAKYVVDSTSDNYFDLCEGRYDE